MLQSQSIPLPSIENATQLKSEKLLPQSNNYLHTVFEIELINHTSCTECRMKVRYLYTQPKSIHSVLTHYYAYPMNLLLLIFVYLGLDIALLIYHSVKLLCVTVSTISLPMLYLPIQTNASASAKYVLTIVVIV